MRAALIQAAAVQVNESLILRAGEILIAPAEARSQGSGTFYKTGFTKGETSWEYLTITQVPTVIEVGGNVEMIAGVGDTTIRASVIRSGGSVEIAAEQGAVNFETANDYVYSRTTRTGKSAVWQSMSDEGVERRTVVHTEITAPDGLDVRAADGIVVQYRAGLPLDETIETLSDLEGLAWMRELRGRDMRVPAFPVPRARRAARTSRPAHAGARPVRRILWVSARNDRPRGRPGPPVVVYPHAPRSRRERHGERISENSRGRRRWLFRFRLAGAPNQPGEVVTLAHYRVGRGSASVCEPHGIAELRLTPLLDDLDS